MRVFLDGSVVEIFLNDELCYSGRIFPESPESTGVDLYVTGGTAFFRSVEIWEMRDRTDPAVGIFEIKSPRDEHKLDLFPNPIGEGELQLHFNAALSMQFSLSYYSMQGQLLAQDQLGILPAGQQTATIQLPGSLPASSIIVRLTGENGWAASELLLHAK